MGLVQCPCAMLTAIPFLVFCTNVSALFTNIAELEPSTALYKCPTDPCDRHQIVWTGDVLLADAGYSRKLLQERGLDFPFAKLRALLSADYVIGNCEGPITSRSQALDTTQHWTYNMIPEVASVLRQVGFSAMGFANNHAFDRGLDGFIDSEKHMQDAGLATFGAGSSGSTAHRPLLIDTPFGKVGVVALFHNTGRAKTLKSRLKAERHEPGTAWLTRGAIVRAKKKARKLGAKWIVAFVHWGTNYKGNILGGQTRAAGYFSQAGYDLVVGHGPHTLQRVERIGKTWILYSLGNFVFTTGGRYAQKNALGHGLVARTYLGPAGFEGVELSCIATDNANVHYQPRICTKAEQEKVFISLGPDVLVEEGLGHIRLTLPVAATVSHHSAESVRSTISWPAGDEQSMDDGSYKPGGVSVLSKLSVAESKVRATKTSQQQRRRRRSPGAAHNTERHTPRRGHHGRRRLKSGIDMK